MVKDLFKKLSQGSVLLFMMMFLFMFVAKTDFKPTAQLNAANSANVSSGTPWAQQIHHTGTPFGGLVTGKVNCTCDNPKYMLFLWDFTSQGLITLLVDPGGQSKLYETYFPDTGKFMVGTHTPKNVCSIRTGDKCFNYQVTGLINRGPGAGVSD